MPLLARRAFVFVSSHRGAELSIVERGLIAVMAQLLREGAIVHLIVVPGSPAVEPAREIGVSVAPYRLTRANVLRTVSRLRKYLRRLDPVVVHTSGLQAAVLTRVAARPLPVAVVSSVMSAEWPPRGRTRTETRAMRTLDRRTASHADLVLVDSAQLRDALARSGYDRSVVKVEPLLEEAFVPGVEDSDGPDLVESLVRHHLASYRRLAAQWEGPSKVKGPKRRGTVRRVRRDAKRAARQG